NSAIHIKAKEVNGCIEVIFINEGKRIPQEQLISIFEKFYRVDGARSSMTGGAGLGLAISKEIVELHKGTIRAESDDDNTRFIVTLPKVKITDKK
ncbi:MAG: ATP-binding protein, partial [Lachnospiraceae bacterium]